MLELGSSGGALELGNSSGEESQALADERETAEGEERDSELTHCCFRRAGELNPDELERIVTIIQNPTQFKIPNWFMNRQKDIVDGKYGQLLSNQLDSKVRISTPRRLDSDVDFFFLQMREDLERLKKIRIHRGLRHYWGLRVRGQHTKTTGRRGRIMVSRSPPSFRSPLTRVTIGCHEEEVIVDSSTALVPWLHFSNRGEQGLRCSFSQGVFAWCMLELQFLRRTTARVPQRNCRLSTSRLASKLEFLFRATTMSA